MHALKRLLAWAGIIDGDTPPPTEKALAENFKVFFENTYGTRAAAANGNGDENAAGAEDTATRRFSQCPNFEALSYLSALEKAKAEMKMLFVYLHGPHHFNSQVRERCAWVLGVTGSLYQVCGRPRGRFGVPLRIKVHFIAASRADSVWYSQAFCKNLCASAEALTFLQSQFLCWGARCGQECNGLGQKRAKFAADPPPTTLTFDSCFAYPRVPASACVACSNFCFCPIMNSDKRPASKYSSTERDGYNMAIQLNVTDFPFVAVVCPGSFDELLCRHFA